MKDSQRSEPIKILGQAPHLRGLEDLTKARLLCHTLTFRIHTALWLKTTKMDKEVTNQTKRDAKES